MLRLQKKAQLNSGARRVVLRSDGVTGAGSKASPISVRNADSGDRNTWAALQLLQG
jgi:hypothetical protein